MSRDRTPETECQTGVSLGKHVSQSHVTQPAQEGQEVQTHNYTQTFHVPSQLASLRQASKLLLTNSLLLAMESYLNFKQALNTRPDSDI